MSTKKLVIYSTNGGKTINHNATTLKELQAVLSENDVAYNGMKMVDNNKMTLENPDAILADNMTNLFLYPVKTKSGATDATNFSFTECRSFITSALESNEEAAKAHFNVDKNYTNKSTATLRELISSYSGSGSIPSSQATQGKAEPAKTSTVGKAKPVKATEKVEAPKAVAKAAPVKAEVAKVIPLESNLDSIVSAIEGLEGDSSLKKAAISAVLKLAPKEGDDLDEDALAKEFRAIGANTPGIRY